MVDVVHSRLDRRPPSRPVAARIFGWDNRSLNVVNPRRALPSSGHRSERSAWAAYRSGTSAGRLNKVNSNRSL